MSEPRRQRIKRVEEVSEAGPGDVGRKSRSPKWLRRFAQKILPFFCLLGAVAVEWKLVNLPAGDVKGQFPVTIRARNEIATFTDVGSVSGGPFSFSYAPATEAEKILLDVYFDRAQLSDETLGVLKSIHVAAPASPGAITYLTSSAGNASCATKIKVEPEAGDLKSVEFSQDESDITSGYRMLATKFTGATAGVTLISQGTFQNGLSPCRIELSVGDWKQSTQGFLPIGIQVPPGAPFRLHWQNLDAQSSSWRTKSAALSLLAFGSDARDEFSARTITINSLNPKTESPNPPRFEARGTKQLPLTVSSFGINQSQLEIDASGKGRVLEAGKVVSTVNVWEVFNKNPILSALIAAGNLALIGWAKRLFFPSHPKRDSDA